MDEKGWTLEEAAPWYFSRQDSTKVSPEGETEIDLDNHDHDDEEQIHSDLGHKKTGNSEPCPFS